MLKRIISLLLSALLISGTLTVSVFAKDPVVYVNETFDDYAENETSPEAFLVTGGVDARVIKRSGTDKAFFAKAWGDNVLGYASVSGLSDKFVISADIKLDGKKTNGTLFSVTDTSGKSVDLLTFSKNGSVTLFDGKHVPSIPYGNWISYAFAFDLSDSKNQVFDFYVNGKKHLENWRINDSMKPAKEISFFASAPDSEGGCTDFYLDNLNVYSGTELLKLPGKTPSSESKPFVETTEIITDKEVEVFNFVDFNTNNSFSTVPKENIIERRVIDDDEHPTVLYGCRDQNTSDSFADITNSASLTAEWQYIFEFYIKLIRNSARLGVSFADTSNAWTTGLYISGNNISLGGVSGGQVGNGRWSKVSVAFDMAASTWALYVDGKQAVSPQKLPNGRFTPDKARIGAVTGSGELEYYVDSIRFYSGRNVVEFEEEPENVETAGQMNASDLRSIHDTAATAFGYIGTAVIFKDDVNAVAFDGKKYKYEEVTEGYPYTDENDVFMIPSDLASKAFEVSVTVNGNNIIAGNGVKLQTGSKNATVGSDAVSLDAAPTVKDGILYLPAKSFGETILGKSYTENRGMHIFSKSKFPYTDGVSPLEIKEPIDVIYRFMQYERKSADEIYAMMDSHMGGNVHPRLLTDKENLERVKRECRTDEQLAKALANTLSDANKAMRSEPIEYKLEGVRLLNAARNVMERLLALSGGYLLTGDTKYADRAWTELESCLAWKDWNTAQHYLDNSELLYGVAVAFDSMYDYFTEEQKQYIMERTWELSLKHSVAAYGGSYSGSEFRKANGNWGIVCNGGIVAACLAFCREGNSEYQPYYDYLLVNALQGLEYPLMLFYPDGAWAESTSYWAYSVQYTADAVLAPLWFSTGTTLGLMDIPGVSETINSMLYLQNGNFGFNYADNGSENKISSESAYLIPFILGDEVLMSTWNNEMKSMKKNGGSVRTLMWYKPSVKEGIDVAELPLDGYLVSATAGSMKEEWNNPDASIVFFKEGRNNTNHSHLDLGTFCFDTMGERWAMELGSDSYNVEGGYWGVNGWELYVKRPSGQNCVVINPRPDVANEYYGGQYLDAYAPLVKMEGKEKSAYAVADLSDAYKFDTSKYYRGYYLGDDRRTLIVQDEMTLLEPNSDIYWFMHTKADIEVDADGKGATLVRNGKKVKVDVLSNAKDFTVKVNKVERRFETDPVRDDQFQKDLFKTLNVFTIEAKGTGNVYFTVKLTPMDADYDTYSKIAYTPIESWTNPDGAKAPKLRADSLLSGGKEIEGFHPGKMEYKVEVPYGHPIPEVSATSSMGTVKVKQSNDFTVPSTVEITGADGKKVTYTISYQPVIVKNEVLVPGLAPQRGIPSGYTVKYGTPDVSVVQQTENPAKHIADGDFSTRWAASGDGVWCEVDLGEVTDISGVAVGIYDGTNRQNIFKLMVSENGTDYRVVYDGKSSGTIADEYEAYMFDTKARFIRYEGYQSTAGEWNSVLELGAIVKK